ncbi:MAG: hypothetical protein ACR2KP_17495, partial [Egibacteraceae bacterium]
SSTVAKMVGSVMRPLRGFTNDHLNREVRWDEQGSSPSPWAKQAQQPGMIDDVVHRFYDVMRRSNDQGRKRGGEWGKDENASAAKKKSAKN